MHTTHVSSMLIKKRKKHVASIVLVVGLTLNKIKKNFFVLVWCGNEKKINKKKGKAIRSVAQPDD